VINQYFKTANFIKPTGDGLLMTFPYDERNLAEVSETVLNACMECLNDFPTICHDDPMINFEVPEAIGFGIARGTACCLYSGEETLDYSGHLLNLASRLNDLARPSGIVIDGGFLTRLIPNTLRSFFKEQLVFIRSIAEGEPIKVFYLEATVKLSESALRPLIGENWRTEEVAFTAKQFASMQSPYIAILQKPADPSMKINVSLRVPMTGKGIRKGSVWTHDFYDFQYLQGPQPRIRLDLKKARDLVRADNKKAVTFRIDFIPKSPQG
jgi:hypothetical protein